MLGHYNRWKNFRTAPSFIMHAVLINYAFDSLSLNTIDNSLGNWIYTSLIITYRTNKRGFFSQRFFPRCFSLSLSLSPFSPLSLPHFSGGHFLLSILPPSPLPGYFFFFFMLPVDSNSQFSIFFVRPAVYPLYPCSTGACCQKWVTFKIIFLIPYLNSKN